MNNMSYEEVITIMAACRDIREITDVLVESKLPLEEGIYCIMAASCYNGEMLDAAERRLEAIEERCLKLEEKILSKIKKGVPTIKFYLFGALFGTPKKRRVEIL